MAQQPTVHVHKVDDLFQVEPIIPIAYAIVDLDREANPVPAILRSEEFAETRRFFAQSPSAARSLLSDTAQALLYTVIRNLRPQHVVEIGTYKAGTTEGLARAVLANGEGMVHTISPFDAERFEAISTRWPSELRAAVCYYAVDSMAFFMQADARGIRPDLVFIDGNHDYEFANFDIQASARRLKPGGFIFVDNVSQAGPYFAARDFLAVHIDWTDCGEIEQRPSHAKAFDPGRTNIPFTDFFILRAPPHYVVDRRPQTFGEMPWNGTEIHGLKLRLAKPAYAGTLSIQCILRGFSETRLAEFVGEGSVAIGDEKIEIDMDLTAPLGLDGSFDHYVVEPWLVWSGEQPLALSILPVPY